MHAQRDGLVRTVIDEGFQAVGRRSHDQLFRQLFILVEPMRLVLLERDRPQTFVQGRHLFSLVRRSSIEGGRAGCRRRVMTFFRGVDFQASRCVFPPVR